MFIKKCLVCLVVSSLFLLTACNKLTPSRPLALSGQLNQICQNLKQEILLDSVRTAPEQYGNDPAKEAQLYKAYKRYHCDEILQKTKKIRVPN